MTPPCPLPWHFSKFGIYDSFRLTHRKLRENPFMLQFYDTMWCRTYDVQRESDNVCKFDKCPSIFVVLWMRNLKTWSWFQVSNLLVTINSSVNLFVYCVFGERFRNELKRMIRPLAQWFKKRKQKRDPFADCGSGNNRVVATQTQIRQLQTPARKESETTQARTLAAIENLQDSRGIKKGKTQFESTHYVNFKLSWISLKVAHPL